VAYDKIVEGLEVTSIPTINENEKENWAAVVAQDDVLAIYRSCEYEVIDLSGRVCLNGNVVAPAYLSLSELADGIYLISLKAENGEKVLSKFVKK
jgi:hypothetical protein